MTDEERTTLEFIKINNEHKYCGKDDVDFLLNLIEKQQKEIEELKTQIDEHVYYDLGGRSCGKTELLRHYKKGYDMNNKFWKYKIKAKIEESELLIDNSQGCMSNEDLYKEFGKIEFGKSLLEKE